MAITGYPISLKDVTTCQPARCPDRCDAQEECVVRAASTKGGAATPYLLTNLYGGDLDRWTFAALTVWNDPGKDADALACVDDFVVVVSNGADAVIYSDDGGASQVEVQLTSGGSGYGPRQIDMVDQTFVVVVGDGGYIWGSYDAARTWETLDAAEATTNQLNRVMIARDNPSVIYAVGNSDTVAKTENGGGNWFTTAATGGGSNLSALWVIDQAKVLVGDVAGRLYETEDGGTTWAEQADLPGFTSAAIKGGTTIADVCGCGCGVLYLVTKRTNVNGIRRVYRNVDGGAGGRWFVPDEGGTSTYDLEAVTCCDSNRAVAVGGDGTGVGNIILLA